MPNLPSEARWLNDTPSPTESCGTTKYAAEGFSCSSSAAFELCRSGGGRRELKAVVDDELVTRAADCELALGSRAAVIVTTLAFAPEARACDSRARCGEACGFGRG